jgi:hypothetical protein
MFGILLRSASSDDLPLLIALDTEALARVAAP